MSTQKYRLAAPTDSDTADTLYGPIVLIAPPIRPRLTTSNKVETSTKRTLLDDKQKVEKTLPFIPPARWWLVLPCLLLILFVSTSDPLLLNDLIVRRYERYYGLDTSPNAQREVCRQSIPTAISRFYWPYPPYYQKVLQVRADYTMVQRDAARFHIKNSIVTLIPALITSLLLGSNCDIIGRRPLLVLPLVGKVIRYSLMLIIVSRDLSDAWLLATHAIEAALGSSGLVMLSALAYITDCTYESTRTRAFLYTEGIAVLIRIMPVLAVGIWLRFYLYTTPLSVSLGLSMIALLYALFIQPESLENV